MPTPLPLPPEFSAVPFSVAEARAAEIPYARLRRADLHSPFRGIRAVERPMTAVDRCVAYAAKLRQGQVFSHASAAALWGMWLPRRLEDDPMVHVLALDPAERPRAEGVRGHRSDGIGLGMPRGMPATSAADTWLQLGSTLNLAELIAAGDSLLRRDSALSSLEELAALVGSGSPRGVTIARKALPLLRAGSDSARESQIRLLLRRARLPESEVNGLITLRDGRVTHGDLVLRDWKVLVEYDGIQHRVTAHQFAIDVRRLEDLAAAGWTVIRVLSIHMDDAADVVRRVVVALRNRGWRGRPSRRQL
jgi:very-short-patch-repair endonuclease